MDSATSLHRSHWATSNKDKRHSICDFDKVLRHNQNQCNSRHTQSPSNSPLATTALSTMVRPPHPIFNATTPLVPDCQHSLLPHRISSLSYNPHCFLFPVAIIDSLYPLFHIKYNVFANLLILSTGLYKLQRSIRPLRQAR